MQKKILISFLKFGIFQGFLQTNFEILLMSQKKTLFFLEKKMY